VFASISPSGDGSNDLSGFHCDMGFMSGSPGMGMDGMMGN
jgi:hypothetical protein